MSRRLTGGGNMTRLHIILDFFELKTELESLKGSRDGNEKNVINKRSFLKKKFNHVYSGHALSYTSTKLS